MAVTSAYPAEHTPEAQATSSPPIAEHGLIGDLQTAALVATDGTIDWYCCPRFDSPCVFARILDNRRGGYFRVAPEHEGYVVKQLYFPDTAVLITRFMSEEGVAELIDFMPIADNPTVATDRHRIVRIMRGVRGEMRLRLECAPRFDYAARGPRARDHRSGAVFTAVICGSRCTAPPAWSAWRGRPAEPRVVRANETFGVVLESAADTPPRPVSDDELWQLFEETVRFLASLARRLHLSRALARDGRPLGA